jgi:hypothetical protein
VSIANRYGPLPPIVTSTTGIAAGRIATEAQPPVALSPAMSCAHAGPAIAKARQASVGNVRIFPLFERHGRVAPRH